MTRMRLLIATGCSGRTGGRRGEWVALYIQKWIECEELPLKNSRLKAYG